MFGSIEDLISLSCGHAMCPKCVPESSDTSDTESNRYPKKEETKMRIVLYAKNELSSLPKLEKQL